MFNSAIEFQKSARFTFCASRCRIEDGALRYAIEDQRQAAHEYRMARAYMGVTKGDVKRAEQPEQ